MTDTYLVGQPPTGATVTSKWLLVDPSGGTPTYRRSWEAEPVIVGDLLDPADCPTVRVCGIQYGDGTVDARVTVHTGRHGTLSAGQARQLANALNAAADHVARIEFNALGCCSHRF